MCTFLNDAWSVRALSRPSSCEYILWEEIHWLCMESCHGETAGKGKCQIKIKYCLRTLYSPLRAACVSEKKNSWNFVWKVQGTLVFSKSIPQLPTWKNVYYSLWRICTLQSRSWICGQHTPLSLMLLSFLEKSINDPSFPSLTYTTKVGWRPNSNAVCLCLSLTLSFPPSPSLFSPQTL